MAKKLCFLVMISLCLLIFEISCAQKESPSPERVSPLPPSSSPEGDSPSSSPEGDSPSAPSSSPEVDSPLPPSSSPEAESPEPPVSSPEPDSQGNSPSQPSQPESPSPLSPYSSSPGPAPVPAPSDDDDSDDDSEPETEYFPSPSPSPAPEVGEPDDIKASEEEYEDERGQDSGMSGSQKAGIAIGVMLGVGAIVIGALVYKKRRDNMTRARYTYFTEGEFL